MWWSTKPEVAGMVDELGRGANCPDTALRKSGEGGRLAARWERAGTARGHTGARMAAAAICQWPQRQFASGNLPVAICQWQFARCNCRQLPAIAIPHFRLPWWWVAMGNPTLALTLP